MSPRIHLGASINGGTPIAGWFMMENPSNGFKWMMACRLSSSTSLNVRSKSLQSATLVSRKAEPWGLDQSENVEEIRSYRNGSYRGII